MKDRKSAHPSVHLPVRVQKARTKRVMAERSMVCTRKKSKIGEVFFWPGWYTVSTCKRETAYSPQERKHHENSHFQRRHSHRVRSVGPGACDHPGGRCDRHSLSRGIVGRGPGTTFHRVRLRPAWPR